ncbi:MAG: response regulator [Candidatus Nealsonbacteria bacterium]|nr:MAG: response regulator [Candidatus Nealsonbacteria bacterium]
MPKKAKVFLVDDNENIRNLIKESLKQEGHEVLIEARSLKEALIKIKDASRKGVTIAIVDGSLVPPGDTFTNDGEKIASTLRKKIPNIRIISFSSHLANWGDKNLVKSKVAISQLGEIVTDL